MPFASWIPRGRTTSLVIFIIRRLLWMVPVLFFVIVITFVLMHLAPGGPWDREGKQLSPQYWWQNHYPNLTYSTDQPIYLRELFPPELIGVMVKGSVPGAEGNLEYFVLLRRDG